MIQLFFFFFLDELTISKAKHSDSSFMIQLESECLAFDIVNTATSSSTQIALPERFLVVHSEIILLKLSL